MLCLHSPLYQHQHRPLPILPLTLPVVFNIGPEPASLDGQTCIDFTESGFWQLTFIGIGFLLSNARSFMPTVWCSYLRNYLKERSRKMTVWKHKPDVKNTRKRQRHERTCNHFCERIGLALQGFGCKF